MDFERKFGTARPKAAEEKVSFAELPPLIDAGAPQQNAADYPDRSEPHSEENAYPSGAFPAFGIAYPEQNIQNISGAFTSAKDFSANSAENSYNQDAEGFQQHQSRANLSIYAPYQGAAGQIEPHGQNREHGFAQKPYDAAQSGEDMASRNYINEERDYQAQSSGGNVHNEPYAEAPPRRERQSPNAYMPESYNADTPGQGFSGQGLEGEFSVQSAHFDPSDYDYNAETMEQAESGAAQTYPQEQAHRQQSGYAPAEAESRYYSEPYQQYYAPQEENYAGQNYDYAPHENSAPPEQVFAAPRGDAGQSDYMPQNMGYQHEEGGDVAAMFTAEDDYGTDYQAQNREADYGAYEPHGVSQGEMPQQTYSPGYGDESFAENSSLPFDAPYEQENEDFAADFNRLNTDASRMDRIAEDFPPLNNGRGERSDRADFRYAEPYAEDGYFAETEEPRRQAYPPEEQVFAEQTEQETEFGHISSGSDKAYDDELYDWTAPVAAGASAAPLGAALRKQPKKSKKTLYWLGFLVILVLGAGAAYWFYGHNSFSGNSEPVVIHRAAGDYKVKPHNSAQSAEASQEQSVTDGVSSGNIGNQQKSLIDKTEQPVEMQKMEERLPLEEQKPFDRSAIDSLIKTALAQSVPVHIVPGVKVNGDRKIIASSVAGEMVLMPGQNGAAAAENNEGRPDGGADAAQTPATRANPSGVARMAAVPTAPPVRPAEAAPPKPQKFASVAPKTQTAAVSGGGFFMQISSQPSFDAAEQSMREAKKHLAPAIAAKMKIVSAVIPDKGTYYRIRIPADSREEAGRLCDEYKQEGGHCFVAR